MTALQRLLNDLLSKFSLEPNTHRVFNYSVGQFQVCLPAQLFLSDLLQPVNVPLKMQDL